jgi:hypothetical protein
VADENETSTAFVPSAPIGETTEPDSPFAGGIALEHVEQLSVQYCLMPCLACAALGLRVGCNREAGHVGVHHCSNYNQGPHEW